MNLKEYFINNGFKISYITEKYTKFSNSITEKMESIYLYNNQTIKILAPNRDFNNLHFETKYFGKCLTVNEFNEIYKNVI